MKNPPKHIEFLDQVRGVAIISVLLFHTLAHVYLYDQLPWNGFFRSLTVADSFLWFIPFASGGVAGVAIFFVVSGFCIHLSFQQQGQRWGIFFTRRFFRIYPPYLAALILSVLLIRFDWRADFHSWEVWKQWLTHLLLIHNLFPKMLMSINGPFWSLAVEAQLYLLYPLLLLFVARWGWRRSLCLLLGVELLIRGADGVVQTLGIADTMAGHVSWLFSYSPLGFWFSWSIGACVADAFLKNQPLPFVKTSPMLWLGLAFASYFVRPLDSFQFPFFALATVAVISRVLSGGTVVAVPAPVRALLGRIGRWSYSIYLLHQPLLNAFVLAVVWFIPPGSFPPPVMFAVMVVTWLGIVALSCLWYQLFELPAIAFGKRMIARKNDRIHTAEGQQAAPSQLITIGLFTHSRTRYGFMIGALLVMVVGTLLVSAELTPPSPEQSNNRAWALATNPEPANRNGKLAVKLAEDACRRTGDQETVMVGTLAAAYAEAGRFNDAILTAEQACQLATQKGESNLLQKNEALLVLYRNHQPYHEQRRAGAQE